MAILFSCAILVVDIMGKLSEIWTSGSDFVLKCYLIAGGHFVQRSGTICAHFGRGQYYWEHSCENILIQEMSLKERVYAR